MVAAEINPRLWDASTPLVERVALAFDEKGPLTKAVKGFCVREGQREFAVEAARAVEEKTILVAEAGTGTGKTFAYLTPALLAGATCVISTAGKSLQDQLCAKDLPALRDALGVPVKVALLKGRANYVCHFRLELTASEGRLPEQDSYLKLRKIQRFAAVSRTGDRAELPDVPEDDRLWPLVTSTRENCLGKDRCPNYDDCFVKKAREDAMQSQVVVVNHHLYLSSMALKRESDAIDGMLPQAALTVIDEAHQLPGIASSFFGTSFSTYDVENVSMEARRLGRTKCNDGAEWEILYDRVLKAGREFRLDAQRIGLAEGERLDVDEIEGFGELYPGFERLRAAFAAMGRIFGMLEEEEEVPEKDPAADISAVKGNVCFEHVQFGYDDTLLMKDVNIEVKQGQMVALVGPTGAGKTTLMNLLLRFYDVKGGSIKIDGVDIRDMKREDLRSLFSLVLQDTWLFSGSIYDNIRYGRLNARKDEVIDAAKMANVHHFIRTLSHGYDTMLNEEANNISQGEKQLLTIARAILKDPQILILDEATSSVDTRLEQMLQEAMQRVMRNRTSFVIAHRLSTIRNADLILVIQHGDIVEQGTHESLLAKKGVYEQLYNSQFADKQKRAA